MTRESLELYYERKDDVDITVNIIQIVGLIMKAKMMITKMT